MKAYSLDLRQRVLADSDAGMPTKPVAEKYGVSRTWVRSLKQRRRETGEIEARVGGGRKPKIDRAKLSALVEAQPDATLAELRERLGIRCSLSAIWTALDKLRITFKKSRCAPPNKTAPTLPRSVPNGERGKPGSIRKGWSSSTKRGRTPR
jgi:transposase